MSRRIFWLLIGAVVVWGINFHVNKKITGILPADWIPFARYSLSGMIMLFYLISSGKFNLHNASKYWKEWLFIGFFGGWLNNYLFYWGIQHTTGTNAALITGLNPLITLILGVLINGTIIYSNQLFGIAVSFIGVLFVIFKGQFDNFIHFQFNFGDILMIGVTTSFAIQNVLVRKWFPHINPLEVMLWVTLFSTPMLFPAATDDFQFDYFSVPFSVWLGFAYISTFGSVLSGIWWYRGIQSIGAEKAAIFINLVPFTAAIAGVFFGEYVHPGQILGGILIGLGVWLSNQKNMKINSL